MAIFEGSKKRMASIRVLEETYLIVFPAFSIEDLSKKHPKIMKMIKEVIIKRRKQNKS
jgi:CRP-like cAMP-binding protein